MTPESDDRGEFATVAVMPHGWRLLINALTQRAGSILVEVTALECQPLEGRSFADVDPIRGAPYRTTLTWKCSRTWATKTAGRPSVSASTGRSCSDSDSSGMLPLSL